MKSLIAYSLSLILAATPVLSASAAQGMDQVRLPAIGEPAGSGELSPEEERRIDEQSMVQIRNSRFYLDDLDVSEYLNRLGYRLVAMAPSNSYGFQFFPLKVPEINAFALPGGFIAVFSGTVLAASDESELAGVMAHEIAHVTQRHIARMFERQRGTGALAIGSFLLAILAAAAGGSSGGNAASAIVMGSQAAMISNQLKFSRSAEQEADRIGFQILTRAGYDPRGMVRFFQRLQQQSGSYDSSNSYLSDHPLTIERIGDMENRARNYPQSFRKSDDFDFLLIQARLLVLQGDRTADWEEAVRQLRLRLVGRSSGEQAAAAHYGLSVAYRQMGRAAAAYEEAEKAAAAAGGRRSVFIDKNLCETRFLAAGSEAEKEAALAQMRRLCDQNPVSSMAAGAYIEALRSMGRHEEILRYLKTQGAFSQDNPAYYRYYAQSSEALGRHSESHLAIGRMYALQGEWKQAAIQFHEAEKASDGDFYTMSEIDARLREAESRMKDGEGGSR